MFTAEAVLRLLCIETEYFHCFNPMFTAEAVLRLRKMIAIVNRTIGILSLLRKRY